MIKHTHQMQGLITSGALSQFSRHKHGNNQENRNRKTPNPTRRMPHIPLSQTIHAPKERNH